MNRTTLWSLVLIGLFVLVFALAKLGTGGGTSGSALPFSVNDADQRKGAENGSLVLVEYSDFQCPACSQVYPVVKQLVDEFPNDLTVVYRHFPLTQIHKHAPIAAQAAEAAGKQDKFWDMHDVLFNTQSSWSRAANPIEDFEKYAESLGLDVEQFRTDLNSADVRDKVKKDENSARSLRGTPTFFLNGKQIQTPGTYEAFKTLLQEELNS
jgi:protein-disulfide isomerase